MTRHTDKPQLTFPLKPQKTAKPPPTQAAVIRPVEQRHEKNQQSAFGRTSPRLLRLRQILAPVGPIPVSKSTWWWWVNSGYAPAPHRISQRITVWLESDILIFIEDVLKD
jgi:predicted DNA-binding transcriptional regulator AlpA